MRKSNRTAAQKQQTYMKHELEPKRERLPSNLGMKTTPNESFEESSARKHSVGNPMRYMGAGMCHINEHK